LFDKARAVDGVFELRFPSSKVEKLPGGRDVWLETVDVCRVSFALAALIAPPAKYPYGSATARAPFGTVLEDQPLLADIDRVVLTDAVVNTATVWAHVWDKAAKLEKSPAEE
jgi:hypothetical protein